MADVRQDNAHAKKRTPGEAPCPNPATPAAKRAKKRTPGRKAVVEEETRCKESNRLAKLEQYRISQQKKNE